jgi:GDP-L-fucose synthase
MNSNEKILVTGGRGLVGSALVEHLRKKGFIDVMAVGRDDCDLTNPFSTREYFEKHQPAYIFHAAARVYGIMGNMKNKAVSFLDNVMINTNVVDAANRVGVKKIVVMGTGAVYPYPSPGLPLKEDMIFMGEPHAAENSYAHAKRAMLAMLRAYEESYGMEWAYVVSCNLFGPRDKFDTEYGHVVPSLIKKFFDAKRCGEKVVVWGNGSAIRDFMYVEDAARASLAIMQNISGAVNSGSGVSHSINDIVNMIADITDMKNRIVWDDTKPNGQDYRAYDLEKINSIGFNCEFTIRRGLEKTWDWYTKNSN